jgi:ribosomal-protein-alanine N-acetyltransferase
MLQLDLSVFPELLTERLLLRELVLADAPALFALRSDPRVMQHIGRPRPPAVSEVEELINTIRQDRLDNNGITWAISLKGSPDLIGSIGFYRLKKEHFRAEVGYMLHPDHWRHGVMGEALQAVVQCGFQRLGFHSIEAMTDARNEASNGLLKKQGFTQEALFREDFYWDGQFLDTAVWSKLAPR